MTDKPHRATILLEDAEVLEVQVWPGRQYVMRLRAPKCAARARPGSFAHVTCDPSLPMRRPLSLMRADPTTGVIEFLFKIVGEGLALLAGRRPGDTVSILGPIGRPFAPTPGRPRALLLGGGVGIPPMVFLAETLRGDAQDRWQPLVIMGSEVPFPFEPAASRIDVPGREWLRSLNATQLGQVEIFACGPTPMLEASARLAREFGLPCQVSLEEFMACAVGGCAGCTVLVMTPAGPAMKRVCVDGPVFDAESVFPPAA